MSKTKRSGWPGVRRFFNDVHLWLGLASGIVVLLICLSGTVYVYNTEIRELAQPGVYHVKRVAGTERLNAEEIMRSVAGETGGQITSIKIPADLDRSYVVTVRKTESEATLDKAPARAVQYLVDPYTGHILGDSQEKTAASVFMGYMFSLHRWLLLDKIEEPLIGELPNRRLGSYISGTATILFTIGVITGIVIWIPARIKNWKRGLKIKWTAGWKRVNHDLHSSLGFYSCILLFLMGITGPQWSFPWYRDALRKSLGTYVAADAPKPAELVSKPNSARLDKLMIKDYLASADQHLDYKGDYTVSIPADSSAVVTINKTRTGFFAPAAGDKLVLDQYSSELIHIEIFGEKPLNERISGSIKAIHVGNVYGSFSKLLYFLACLVATSLPVTGTLIWINKFKKKAR